MGERASDYAGDDSVEGGRKRLRGNVARRCAEPMTPAFDPTEAEPVPDFVFLKHQRADGRRERASRQATKASAKPYSTSTM